MNYSFENQGTHTFLVYTVTEDDIVDSMSLGMLTNNKIHGLAHTIFTQMDATKYIKYDVSAKISVKQFFSGPVNKKRLLGVFNGIVDAMLSAEEYMIDENSIVLDLDCIFADVSTCETVLICLPLVPEDLKGRDLGAFFKNIMFTTQFDQTENCDHVAKIINYLNSTPTFSLEGFKKILESVGGAAVPMQNQSVPVQSQNVNQQRNQVQQPVQKKAPVQQPVQSKPAEPVQAPPVQTHPAQGNVPEKKISMMDLLMHYSKENAELYKQQKAAKKSGQTQATPSAVQQSKPQAAQSAFAIPGEEIPVNQDFAVPGQQTPVSQTPVQTAAQQPAVNRQVNTQPKVPQGQSMNFGETVVLGNGSLDDTAVLGTTISTHVKPHIIRLKNNEKVALNNKTIFRIGKEKNYVDYFISDNSAISRSHANIIERGGEYFVVDTNSTNHTYVDGKMIQSNSETKLAHGTKIRFANEDFEFRLF